MEEPPISLGKCKSRSRGKVELQGTSKVQENSTHGGGGALSKEEGPQKKRLSLQETHWKRTQDLQWSPCSTTEGSNAAGDARRGLCVTGKSAGDWGYTEPEDPLEEMTTSLGSCKRHSAWGYCPVREGKGLPPPKLDSWQKGPRGTFQTTTCDAGSTQLRMRGDPRSRSSLQLVPADAGE
ncbi:hypothetical protein NDU88_004635 [Pleurodeles waltl]|uniref:Prolactin receptor n=1 Tax=Pleurodeles waltl TaxID=8319 RepID=A0AAV7PGA5_PLEWA|nr:hypothetical protein NDU88_004635 [Pleurodeles waltl]